MTLGNILWWFLFAVCAVWGQTFFSGVDFLVAGFVISLQEERRSQSLWLALVFILIQEGTGTLPFGGAIIWYLATILVYRFGRYLFESQNFLFILLLGAGLGGLQYGLTRMMMEMQGLEFDSMALAMTGFMQTVLFPLVWGVAKMMRPRCETDAAIG